MYIDFLLVILLGNRHLLVISYRLQVAGDKLSIIINYNT